MRANTHFYVMITQFVLLIYCTFSLIHSYDTQNIFSVVFESASPVMFMAPGYMQ